MRECGKCLLDAMELGRCVLHRSGEEGIDELWGEPFRAFSIPLEDFYESRYIKIGRVLRDIDRISQAMIDTFSGIPAFADIEAPVLDLASAAKIKTETLRTDGDIFDVWARMVTAAERLGELALRCDGNVLSSPMTYNLSDGLQLIRQGRDLIFYISRARTAMPKSTQDFINRCATASAGAAASSQARAASAFISVSGVVNDLEATINKVVAGSSPSSACARCWPSRLATKRMSSCAAA